MPDDAGYTLDKELSMLQEGETDMYHSILQGQTRLDTNGNRIQAHGGSGIWHWGVGCYSVIENCEDAWFNIQEYPQRAGGVCFLVR